MVEIGGRKWRMLIPIAVARLSVLTLWLSGTAVGPELTDVWELTSTGKARLTNAVQLGFVVGALASAAMVYLRTLPEASALAGGRG